MTINSTILNSLSDIGVPVSFQVYSGPATTYITFLEYNQFSGFTADDDEQITSHFIQIDVWSLGDYSDLVDQVKAKMKEIGFIRTTEADLYESDTEIFHKALRFRLN